MSKRNPGLPRHQDDFYPTPESAVIPLLRHLPLGTTFCDPCAGDAALIKHLQYNSIGARCVWASDINPRHGMVQKLDAMNLHHPLLADLIITNPPWDVKILHPLIDHLKCISPTWLLLYSDWLFTNQAQRFLADDIMDIVPIGRVKWIEGSASVGFDNCAWIKFWDGLGGEAKFHPRAEHVDWMK